MESANKSLKRLQIETIDLYQAHIDDADTPLEETLGAFSDLIKEGKVRAVGASNYKPERLKEALAVSRANGLARYESMQPEYNLYDREGYEADLEPLCVAEGLGVITYFSLARGFLSGKYHSSEDLSKSARGDGVKKYLNERGFRIIEALQAVASELNGKPAQIALAWLMARPSVSAPIAVGRKAVMVATMIVRRAVKLEGCLSQ
jgi:aryl-alcohol dehydrogenase-like predicted oxidoreductase